MLAMQMAAPPPGHLHAALARCFAAPQRRELPHLLGVLEQELRSPHAARKTMPVPRVVLSRALWKLAEVQLDVDGPAPARLARLLPALFGCTLEELRCLRDVRARPWQVLARDFGILDYSIRSDPGDAEISLVVDRPIAALHTMLDPKRWATRAALFWTNVGPVRSGAFRARFKLPSPGSQPVPVRVRLEQQATSVGFDAEVTIAGHNTRTAFDCVARISVETPRGGAWTTRITQRKALRGGGPIADMLTYWTQAETLCLALPV
jgi:hypothetical protein